MSAPRPALQPDATHWTSPDWLRTTALVWKLICAVMAGLARPGGNLSRIEAMVDEAERITRRAIWRQVCEANGRLDLLNAADERIADFWYVIFGGPRPAGYRARRAAHHRSRLARLVATRTADHRARAHCFNLIGCAHVPRRLIVAIWAPVRRRYRAAHAPWPTRARTAAPASRAPPCLFTVNHVRLSAPRV
jgi:hypothetical protein